MGFWSTIGDFIGGALGAVAGALSSLGSLILGAVANIVTGIAKMLGVLEEEDNVEELGAKAMVAEKKPEDFDSNKAYIEYLKNEVQLDQEAFDQASEKERLGYKCTGLAIANKGVEEELGAGIPVGFLKKAGEQNLSPEDAHKTINTFKEDGLDNYAKYFDGKLDGEVNKQWDDKIVSLYKDRYPSMSESEIYNKIDEDKIQR